MSEAQHLADSLERLFSNPKSGVFAPFITVTDGLTAAQAATVPAPRFNSVWAVVNHVWFWEETLLRPIGHARRIGRNDRAWLARRRFGHR
jgi:hypothetical protein